VSRLRPLPYTFLICISRHPDDLYKNGIQRSSFIPCIEHIKATFDVTDLDSGTDYRRLPRSLSKVYFHPLDFSTDAEINKIFHALAGSQPIEYNRPLTIWGRTLNIPESAGRIAKFTFKELCGAPLSAADYLEVTKHFGTVFLVDVKKMTIGEKDLARRFITFIDGPCVFYLSFF
jgi:protein AFG1